MNHQLLHSSSGQIIITANWQLIDSTIYSDPKCPRDIANKKVESHQQIWNILVDVDKGEILKLYSRRIES